MTISKSYFYVVFPFNLSPENTPDHLKKYFFCQSLIFVAKCFTHKQTGAARAKTHRQMFYLSFGKFAYSLAGFLLNPAEFIVNISLDSAVFNFQEGVWPHKCDLSVKSAKLFSLTHKEKKGGALTTRYMW